jgi:transposase
VFDRWVERIGHMPDTELLPKSKLEPVRRLEVFTGTGRRRAWSAEQKAEIVAESYESGERVSAVARRHALTPQQLFGWRRAARRRIADRGAGNGSLFAPVVVDAGRPDVDMRPAQARPGGAPMIEIVVGAATVRIPPGIDAGTLTTVLRAVRVVR